MFIAFLKRPFYMGRSALVLLGETIRVSWQRVRRGPRLSDWSWMFEVMTCFLQQQERIAFAMPAMGEKRLYTDALVFPSPALRKVQRASITDETVRGCWYTPLADLQERTVLYLHGGGYAFYSRLHENLIALVALAARARTFALDYRLTPEHAFPAQLEDALAAYRWLLKRGQDPGHLIVIGDSAGGNLVLALLLALRDAHVPLPELGVCISPWTDVECDYESMSQNEAYDWVNSAEVAQFRRWFVGEASSTDPLVSPIHADLSGLPPLYIQAGDAEILIDMIRDFTRRAREQEAQVELEDWEQMNHDFQAFGTAMPQSAQALRRLGQVIDTALSVSPSVTTRHRT
jgi:acetyl esterase/lipase